MNGNNNTPHKPGFLANMIPRYWAWLHFIFALGVVWPVMSLIFPSRFLDATVDYTFVLVWSIPTIAGAFITAAGLVMSTQPMTRSMLRTIGVTVELIGLFFFSIGPLAYFGTFIGAFLGTNEGISPAIIVYSYAMIAAIITRFVVIVPRVYREFKDARKVVKFDVRGSSH